MTILGSLGFGFVWGWLVGLIIGRRPRPFPWLSYLTTITPLLITTGSFAYSIYYISTGNITLAIIFCATTLGGALLHNAFLQAIRLKNGIVTEQI